MKLEEKSEASVEPFEAVQSQIEAKIILERRREAIDKLNEEVMQQAAIENADRFIDFCLERIYRTSNR